MLAASNTVFHPRLTLQDRLALTGGRPSGFDYLRIILASSVIFTHSLDLTAGYNVTLTDLHGFFRPIYELILPMFFALSGFLVAGSLERSRSLISFLGLRAIRLVPALFVETVLGAIVIGLVFTALPYRDYFTSRGFAHYFLNIVGDIHVTLPGVFQHNPVHTVNRQLWTVPWELHCYEAIALLAILGVARRKELLLLASILFSLLLFADYMRGFHLGEKPDPVAPGIILMQCFLYGICLFAWRGRVPWRSWLAVGSFICICILEAPAFAAWGDRLIALPVAYLTVYLGLLEPKRLAIITSGDYSYGIYLYGFPVQQSVIALFGHPVMSWWLNFLIAFPVAAVLAAGSWHLVEKHAALLRPALFALERLVLGKIAGFRLRAGFVPDSVRQAGEQGG